MGRLSLRVPRPNLRNVSTFVVPTPRTNLLRRSPLFHAVSNFSQIEHEADIFIASALSLDTRGARWEEFSREKENYRQRSVQQQFNNGDFLERVGTVRD
ncbi:hypothetical protein MTP99_003057 [Tenebrio molitor]|nr:hypothetical protein MTP99_003057 [Tenebrio molitor]